MKRTKEEPKEEEPKEEIEEKRREEIKLIESVAYRYGLVFGQKLAKGELRRAISDHPNTRLLKEIRQQKRNIERNLIFRNLGTEMRNALIDELHSAVDKMDSYEKKRREDTENERKKVHGFNTTIKYFDEVKILPTLERLSKLRIISDIPEEKVSRAERVLRDLKK